MAINSVPPHPDLHPPRRRLLPSWSQIPEELLWLILQRISDWADLHQCLGVCPLWRSTARLVLRRITATPFLLLINPEQKQEPCKFLDLGTTTLFCLKAGMELTNYTIYNSNRGWLLMRSNTNRQEYSLYNPITRDIVQLPPPPLGPLGILCSPSPQPPAELKKLVISTRSPRDPNCVVFLLFHHPNLLAFCKPASSNNNTFKVIKGRAHHLVDMIFYKGELYAVNLFSELYVMTLLEGDDNHDQIFYDNHDQILFEGDDNHDQILFQGDEIFLEGDDNHEILFEGDYNDEIVVQEHQIVEKLIKKAANKGHEFYLVEEPVRKELHLVVKVEQSYRVSFRIFKLKFYYYPRAGAEWEEVSKFDIDNRALVLVTGDSMFVSTDDDESCCYKPNCIYFVDEFRNSNPLNYVKVYDLKTHTVEPFNFHPSHSHSQPLASQELCRWFRPSTII